jgi:glycosyltransferase involved in cell wall biosynthesis
VIIPCFNDGRTLPDAIDSVLRQESCEIVVIDDGSDDAETAHVLDGLPEKSVRVLRQDRQGAAAARAVGLSTTTAPYVFPLDADDRIAPGALRDLADALDANPSAAAAWGDIEVFGDYSGSRHGPRQLDPWLLTYVNNITGGATLIRRSRLDDVGGWQMKDGYQAWDLWLSFAERGWTGIYIPRVVLHYRQHGPRLSAVHRKSFAAFYDQLRERHPSLFRQRRTLWRQSHAGWRLKLALPIIATLPLSALFKHRLQNFMENPRRFFRVQRARIARHIERARGRKSAAAPLDPPR